MHSDIYEIGILTLESDIYRSWRSSLSAYPSQYHCVANITPTSHRQLRMFVEAKIH